MNKKVFVSMLFLCIAFLFGLYVVKIFFPQEFVMIVENEKLIAIGNFIDSHRWCYYLVCCITAFITYWLYLCACCSQKRLKIWQIAIVIAIILGSCVVDKLDPNIAMYYSIISMIVLPALFKGKLGNIALVFSVHIIAQYLSLSIRNLALIFSTFNSLIGLIMTAEMYLWLSLFYIIFNYKEKEI
jgi:hypothetical protein